MKQSSAQLALDDFLWSELPAPTRHPKPAAPPLAKPTCRLQRRLMYRHRQRDSAPPSLRLLPPLR